MPCRCAVKIIKANPVVVLNKIFFTNKTRNVPVLHLIFKNCPLKNYFFFQSCFLGGNLDHYSILKT